MTEEFILKPVTLALDPIGKPRMTQSDKWKERPVVQRYWSFKNVLGLMCNKAKIKVTEEVFVVFYIAMPKSWNKMMKDSFRGQPHKNKPDCDNMLKAILDCLVKEDQHVYKVRAEKYWADKGGIKFVYWK